MIFPQAEVDLYRTLWQMDSNFVAKLQNKDRPNVKFHESDRVLKELFAAQNIPDEVAQDVHDRYRAWVHQFTNYLS